MKTFRIILWAAVFALGAFLAYNALNWTMNKSTQKTAVSIADIGGPFTAQRTDGSKITQEDMLGRPHALFFGFTHCPDICPTTLYEASQWLKALGENGDKLDIYFVTVDPERDTAPLLKQYLTAFDPRIKGITGTSEQIQQLIKAWRVFAKKEGEGEDYTMSHTATTFLMNKDGKFVGTVSYGENQDTAIEKLRKLATGKN